MTVLDALDAGRDRPLDRGRRIGVHGDVSLPIRRGLDARAQLGLAERHHVERCPRRRHPAAGGELDLRRSLQQLLASPETHLVGAVGDAGRARSLERARSAARVARKIGQRTEVAVAAARCDHRARRIDARPGREAVVDRLFQAKRRAAEVADGGETAHQRALGLGPRGQHDEADVCGQKGGDRESGEDRMPVRVDQARHERPPAAVDGLRSGRRRELVRRQRLDPPGLDQEAKSALQRGRLAVEEEEIGENDRTGRVRRLRPRTGRKAESGEGSARAGDEAPPRELAVDPPRDLADLWRAATATDVRDRLGALIGWSAREHVGPKGERPPLYRPGDPRKKPRAGSRAALFTIL